MVGTRSRWFSIKQQCLQCCGWILAGWTNDFPVVPLRCRYISSKNTGNFPCYKIRQRMVAILSIFQFHIFRINQALPPDLSHPDLSAFVFSAETYGTKGVDDLYITRRGADGKWSEPKNLGVSINTQFQELSPSLSADGKTLYFSSNGRKGKGALMFSRLPVWMIPGLTGVIRLRSKALSDTEGRDLFYRPYEEATFCVVHQHH